ncbi:12594_t:CDS:2 [Ambispora gerdemannii]|uniref:12594_t:CDS:1 n=1 Tax=Ambispora gerdemannii TaxID=144530 RepID=A0A9N8VDA9_9GLOM|nr:12594_t:CDS:2 [Ambispora gerdemannii]
MFIQYTIVNTELVYIITPDAFGELIFLMEFKGSSIFTVGPGVDYQVEVGNSIDQVQLLNLLICMKKVYLTIILRRQDCDSLAIVHYYLEGSSKFSDLEKHGILKLKYKSVEEFHLALRQAFHQ